ncbi:MAG: hypothetical protein H6613_05895 [Ignavibacteriales bacterium]|nr:hypothetical protein [Ignavibacteriales bacterium]
MLLNGNNVLENIDEANLSKELEIAKFRNYGREHFSDLIKDEISFEYFINHSSKFYSINLPREISDYFLRLDTAQFFWISECTVIKQVEDLLFAKNNKFNFVSNYREIKKYYSKWITQKTTKEKQYFALSIGNQVDRNFTYQSFYNLIIYGTILTFDKSVYNPHRAIELFTRAIEVINNCDIDPPIKTELLYYTNIFKGFAHLQEYEYKQARNTFIESLNYNEHGVNAYYYIALSSRYLDDFDSAFDGLKSVLEFDRMRFQYAINYNHLKLFSFFYNGANFYNVFNELGFAQLLPDIDFLLRSLFSSDSNSMDITYSKLINLDNLRIKSFFDDSVSKEIEFLKNALDSYKQKRNGLIRIVEQIFRDKLITLIEYVRNLIESHYFEQIKEDINVFDKQIEQNKRQLALLKQEREDAKKKISMTKKEASDHLEESLAERAKHLEAKIKHLDESHNYNPQQVFYSSMIFTVVISIIVFLVVGTISSIMGLSEESSTIKALALSGIKWGGVTFLLGIGISIFTSISSMWEKNDEKKNLVNKLKYVKEMEAQERSLLEEESVLKTKIYEQKFIDRITTQEKIIKEFVKERDQNYNYKYNIAKKEIDDFITPLNNLLTSLENAG